MLILVVLCVQTQVAEPQKPPEPQPPVALERIRRALESPVVVSTEVLEDGGRQVFRVYINETSPSLEWLWREDGRERFSKVQPYFPLYHHEFLETKTPEDFRAAVLNPIGVDVIPLVEGAVKKVHKALRAREVTKTRTRVKKELAMLLEARKAAGEKDP